VDAPVLAVSLGPSDAPEESAPESAVPFSDFVIVQPPAAAALSIAWLAASAE